MRVLFFILLPLFPPFLVFLLFWSSFILAQCCTKKCSLGINNSSFLLAMVFWENGHWSGHLVSLSEACLSNDKNLTLGTIGCFWSKSHFILFIFRNWQIFRYLLLSNSREFPYEFKKTEHLFLMANLSWFWKLILWFLIYILIISFSRFLYIFEISFLVFQSSHWIEIVKLNYLDGYSLSSHLRNCKVIPHSVFVFTETSSTGLVNS